MLGFSPLSSRSISGLLRIETPSVVTTDTHDYPFPVVEEYRKRINRQARLRREEEEKQRKINNIRAHIDKVLRKEEKIEKAIAQNEQKPSPIIAEQHIEQTNLLNEIVALEQQIVQLQKQLELEYIAFRKLKEDRDIETLLYLM